MDRAMKWIVGAALLSLLIPCPSPAQEKKAKVLRIANYDYILPPWWDTVAVEAPEDLRDEGRIRSYVQKQYGADVGTAETWKKALKTWAIACQRNDLFPVYLAHCHAAGGDHERAAEVYAGLYRLADSQKGRRDWYRTYLAHNAGNAFERLKNIAEAARWHSRAARYLTSPDSAVEYYARQSAEKLKRLKDK